MEVIIKRLPLLAFLIAATLAFGASATAFAGAARSQLAAINRSPQPSVSAAQSAPRSSLPDSAGDANALVSEMQLPLQPVPTASPTPTPTPVSAGAAIPAAPTERTGRVLHVPVLMYHYISAVPANQAADRFAVDLRVPPDLFEQHLAYLRSQGYNTLSVPALWIALNGGEALPAKPIILTFDDGYADAYANALPLLKKYGFTGTFFVTCNLIGKPGYMTWDQVRELDTSGMDIESHAMDHKPMSAFSLAGLAYQLGQARATLSQQLGHDVRFFAYPSGDYNATAIQGLAANGYFAAFLKGGGSAQSIDWRYTLRRARVSGYATVDALKAALRF
jgi:peptidoglycan/xylan/chitin deacetylase (PgdA/CDA1 family)